MNCFNFSLNKFAYFLVGLVLIILTFNYYHIHTSRYILPILQEYYGSFDGIQEIEKIKLFKTIYYKLYYYFVEFFDLYFDNYYSMLIFVAIIKFIVLLFIYLNNKIQNNTKWLLLFFYVIGSDGFIGSDYIFPTANYHALLSQSIIFIALLWLSFTDRTTFLRTLTYILLSSSAIFFHSLNYIHAIPLMVVLIFINTDYNKSHKMILSGALFPVLYFYKIYIGDTPFNNITAKFESRELFLKLKGEMVHNSLAQSYLDWLFFVIVFGFSLILFSKYFTKIQLSIFYLLTLSFLFLQLIGDVTDSFYINYLQLMRSSIWFKTGVMLLVVKIMNQNGIEKFRQFQFLLFYLLLFASGYLFLVIVIALSLSLFPFNTSVKRLPVLIYFFTPFVLFVLLYISSSLDEYSILNIGFVGLFLLSFMLLLGVFSRKAIIIPYRVLFVIFYLMLGININRSNNRTNEIHKSNWYWIRLNASNPEFKWKGPCPSALIWVDPIYYNNRKK
jgi:hypothetical protein